MTEFRLPASVQPQVWVNDDAVDSGPPIRFDAHDAMIEMDTETFSRVAREALSRRHDIDELAIDSGVISEWLERGADNTFTVTLEDHDLSDWLTGLGVSEDEAKAATPELLGSMRERAGCTAPAP